MRVWKLLGMAGLAGVAATGVVLARDERERRAYTPDDVRERLRERAAAAEPDPGPQPPPATTRSDRLRRRAGRYARRLPSVTPFRRLRDRLDQETVDGPA